MPLIRAADLTIAAVAQAGAALTLASNAPPTNPWISALSVGSMITAVGAVFVMREKIARAERDILAHKEETAEADTAMARAFTEALKDHRDIAAATLLEHRREMLAEATETRTQLNEIVKSLGHLEGVMSSCPLHIQQGGRLP